MQKNITERHVCPATTKTNRDRCGRSASVTLISPNQLYTAKRDDLSRPRSVIRRRFVSNQRFFFSTSLQIRDRYDGGTNCVRTLNRFGVFRSHCVIILLYLYIDSAISTTPHARDVLLQQRLRSPTNAGLTYLCVYFYTR